MLEVKNIFVEYVDSSGRPVKAVNDVSFGVPEGILHLARPQPLRQDYHHAGHRRSRTAMLSGGRQQRLALACAHPSLNIGVVQPRYTCMNPQKSISIKAGP